MLIDVHEEKTSIEAVAAKNTTTAIVAANPNAWIYIHELMGDLDVTGTITIKAGTTVLAEFNLDAGQGLTAADTDGWEGAPRFKCKPGDAFNITMSADSVFQGTCVYSLRY